MASVLITGAGGFIGKRLCEVLSVNGFDVYAVVRNEKNAQSLPKSVNSIVAGDIAAVKDWASFLVGVDVVVHLAARVHQMREEKSPPGLKDFPGQALAPLFQKGGQEQVPFSKGRTLKKGEIERPYQKINVDVTVALAEACVKAGVKRFVFASSVKAMGESTAPGEVWNETTPSYPKDPYGRSKLAAEQELKGIGKKTGLEVVILRFPLVYGAGVKANMEKLVKAVERGIPLPFASVRNKRSLLYVGNAVDAIKCCLTHPAAPGETFLVSDGEAVSTPELIRYIAEVRGHAVRLFSFPPFLLRVAGKALGQSGVIERLAGSLAIDSGKILLALNWRAPYSLMEGLKNL